MLDALRSAFTLPNAMKRAEITGEDWQDVFVEHVRLIEGDAAADELAETIERCRAESA